jgi:hypothetical protein
MNVAQETLGFRRGSLSLPLSLLMSAFALPIPPARFSTHLRRPTERSPTIYALLLKHYPYDCTPNQDSLCSEGAWLRGSQKREPATACRTNALKGAHKSRASVIGLAPLHLPRRTTRSVSYYAFFKGWLLLSQLPDCFRLPTSFST